MLNLGKSIKGELDSEACQNCLSSNQCQWNPFVLSPGLQVGSGLRPRH